MPADSELAEFRDRPSAGSDHGAIATARAAGVGVFDGSPVSTRIARMIPAELSRRHRLIPVDQRRARVVVAMVDPTDAAAQETVRHITGLRVEPVAISTDVLQALIDTLLVQDEPAEPIEPTTLFGVPPVNSRRAARAESAERSDDSTDDSTNDSTDGADRAVAADPAPAGEQTITREQPAPDDDHLGDSTAAAGADPSATTPSDDTVVAQPVSAATASIAIIHADATAGDGGDAVLPSGLPETSAADDTEVDDVRELLDAMRSSGATAVHIDVAGGRESVTARVNGELVDWPRRRPIAAAVTHAVGIPLRRRPVAAQSTLEPDGDEAPLQVAVTPTATGQSIVLRVPAQTALADGVAEAIGHHLLPVLHAPRGLVLVAAGAVGARTAALEAARAAIDDGRRVIALGGGLPVTDTVVVPAADVAELTTVLHAYDADTIVVHDTAVLGDAILDVAAETLVIAAVRAPDAASAIHRVARMTGDGATVAALALAVVAVRSLARPSTDERSITAPADQVDGRYDVLHVDDATREAIGDDVPLTTLRRVVANTLIHGTATD